MGNLRITLIKYAVLVCFILLAACQNSVEVDDQSRSIQNNVKPNLQEKPLEDVGSSTVIDSKVDDYAQTDNQETYELSTENIIKNKFGVLEIALKYDEAGAFSDGFAAVLLDGKWGFINRDGILEIKNKYDEVKYFSEGLAAVRLDSLWGYINNTGNVVIDLQFNSASNFSEGLAAVREGEDKWGYINNTGELVVPYQRYGYIYWDSPGEFHEGRASILSEGKYGFIDTKGNVIIEPQYNFPANFSEGLAGVFKDFNVTYINKSGEAVIITGVNGHYREFSEGLAAVMSDGKWGFIDKTGKLVIDYQYTEAYNFSGGLAAVKIEQYDKFGYIDQSGKTVIEPKFLDAKDFHEGLALVQISTMLGGYINKEGNQLSDSNYSHLSGSFYEGFAAVQLQDQPQGKFGYIQLVDISDQEKQESAVTAVIPEVNKIEYSKSFYGRWVSTNEIEGSTLYIELDQWGRGVFEISSEMGTSSYMLYMVSETDNETTVEYEDEEGVTNQFAMSIQDGVLHITYSDSIEETYNRVE